MKKRILCLLLVLALIPIPLPVSAAQSPVIRCGSAQGQPGEYLYFPVTAEDLEELAALELGIYYDAQALEFISCDNGWLLGEALASTNHREGEITFTAVSIDGISGSGELLYLSFRVKEGCPQGRYPLTLAVGEAYDVNRRSVTVTAKNGWITVTGYTPVYSEFHLELGLSAETLTPGENLTATVYNSWWMGFASCDLSVHYDADKFRLVDARVCGELENALYSLNTDTPGLVRLTCASVQSIWCYEMLELTLEAHEDAVGTSLLTAGITDVYNSDRIPYLPGSARQTVTVLPAESVRHPRLRLEGGEPVVGEETEMTLVLDEGSGLAAADFELTYDPALLECVDVRAAGSSQLLLINPNFQKGSIRFSFVEEQGVSEELPLVTITWRAKAGADRHYAFRAELTDPVDAQFKPIIIESPAYSGCIRIRETVAATCETPGGEQLRCVACGDVIPVNPRPPLGHSYGDPVFVWGAGYESCEAYRVCARDEGHIWKVRCTVTHESTGSSCTAPGSVTYTATADFYGESYTDTKTEHRDVLGHDYDWVTVTEPGCESAGLRRGSCIRCGHGTEEVLEPLGHEYTSQITSPGCTEGGFTTHTCTRCGNSYTDGFTEPTGHRHEWFRMADPTCDADGWEQGICSGCGDVQTRTIPALGHDWSGTTCSRCGAMRDNPFTDVPEGSFYYDPVLWAVKNGITTGATATTFNPGGECQRAQVVTFLWRAAGSPEPATTRNPFTDVKERDFYYKAVLWAVENGITNGLTATQFGPFAKCNRAQVVTFLWRAQGSPGSSAAVSFTDVLPGQFYSTPVAWAVEHGITNGISATEFGVGGICNRAQVVTFLFRSFSNP